MRALPVRLYLHTLVLACSYTYRLFFYSDLHSTYCKVSVLRCTCLRLPPDANRYLDKSMIRDDYCARPDCDHPQFIAAENEFFVERIMGRAPFKESESEDTQEFIWLVKWVGYAILARFSLYVTFLTKVAWLHSTANIRYPTTQATWENKKSFSDAADHITAFEEATRHEGLDLDDPNQRVILREALAVGWW